METHVSDKMTQEDEQQFRIFLKERDEMQKRLQSLEPLPEKRHLRKDLIAYRALTDAVQFFCRGTFRWSIIACGATLEYLLKKKINEDEDFYKLIDNAEKTGLITKYEYHLLHSLRLNRNDLIHELENNADETIAKIVLLTSFKIFNTVVPAPIDSEYNFELYKQGVSDDHYSDRLIDLNKFSYQISFKPTPTIDYWRFGIKFSHNEHINTDIRTPPDQPLFHFTKEKGQNKLLIHRYGSFKESHDFSSAVFLENYRNEEIKFLVSKHKESVGLTFIFDKDTAQHPLLGELHGFSFAKLFAWADGDPFRFYGTIREMEKM